MKLLKSISILILITFLSGILGVTALARDLTIKDLQSTDESYSTVQWVINQGYMSLTLGKFFPAKYVKRSEFAAIICKLTGSGTVLQNPKKATFQDVNSKNQFYRQIETAKTYMTYFKSKTGKLFKPDGYLTREDAMMSIVKVLGYDSDEAWGSNDNTDVSLDDIIEDAAIVNPSLVKYVSIGVSNELMDLRDNGDKSYFDPKKNISRKDLAVLIYNAYQKKDYTVAESSDDNNNSGNIDNNQNSTSQNNSNTHVSNSEGVGSNDNSNVIHEDIIPDISVIKLDDPATKVDTDKDCVLITKVTPDKDLQENISTNITVEFEYNLISKGDAKLAICFNDGDQPQIDIARAVVQLQKGSGKYRVVVPEAPVYWDGDIPFRVSAVLNYADNSTIILKSIHNLNFVRMDKFNVSDCVSFLRGTVYKVYSPVNYVDPNQNSVHINWIKPDKDLQAGKEIYIKIEVEYSLVSQDGAMLGICYNNSDYSDSQAQMENARWEVPKGTGKYIFNIPVTPKRWSDGTPFQLSAQLHNYEDQVHPEKHNAYICGVPPIDLKLK